MDKYKRKRPKKKVQKSTILDDQTYGYYLRIASVLSKKFESEVDKSLFVNNVLVQLKDEALKVSKDPVISGTVEQFIPLSTSSQLFHLFENFSQDWEVACCDRVASYVTQSLLKNCKKLFLIDQNGSNERRLLNDNNKLPPTILNNQSDSSLMSDNKKTKKRKFKKANIDAINSNDRNNSSFLAEAKKSKIIDDEAKTIISYDKFSSSHKLGQKVASNHEHCELPIMEDCENEKDIYASKILLHLDQLTDFLSSKLALYMQHSSASHIIRVLLEVFSGLTDRAQIGGRKANNNTAANNLADKNKISKLSDKKFDAVSCRPICNGFKKKFQKRFRILSLQIFQLPKLKDHIHNPLSNPVLQIVLNGCTSLELKDAVKLRNLLELNGQLFEKQIDNSHLLSNCSDEMASHLIESYIKSVGGGASSESQEFERIYNAHFKGNLVEMAKCPTANHVLQRLLENCRNEKQLNSMLDELSGFIESTIAIGHISVVQKMVDASLKLKMGQKKIIKGLQKAFHCRSPADRRSSLLILLLTFSTYEVVCELPATESDVDNKIKTAQDDLNAAVESRTSIDFCHSSSDTATITTATNSTNGNNKNGVNNSAKKKNKIASAAVSEPTSDRLNADNSSSIIINKRSNDSSLVESKREQNVPEKNKGSEKKKRLESEKSQSMSAAEGINLDEERMSEDARMLFLSPLLKEPLSLSGSLLLQSLFNFADNQCLTSGIKRLTELEDISSFGLLSVCRDPCGSRALESFLKSSTVGEGDKAVLYDSLKDHYVDLTCHKTGSRFFDCLWQEANLERKVIIMNQLIRKEDRLKTDRYGFFVWSKCNFTLYRNRLQEWKKRFGQLL